LKSIIKRVWQTLRAFKYIRQWRAVERQLKTIVNEPARSIFEMLKSDPEFIQVSREWIETGTAEKLLIRKHSDAINRDWIFAMLFSPGMLDWREGQFEIIDHIKQQIILAESRLINGDFDE